jgi:hypothetical protein
MHQEIMDMLHLARANGWLMEPQAKKVFALAGLPVPRFVWAADLRQSLAGAVRLGYPLVAKVVSPAVVHKSEVAGVEVGIADETQLRAFYDRVSALPGFAGLLIEEMAAGMELIAGAKIDLQFGLIILLGIGGTSVEVYDDVAVRMAPLLPADVEMMLRELKGEKLLSGFRGKPAVNREALARVVVDFAALVQEMAPYIASIDLNPLLCGSAGCVIADARIILNDVFVRTGGPDTAVVL